MPIYEYVCPSCERRFERMRPMSERLAPVPCDACGSDGARLAFSVPGHVGAGAPAAAVAPGGCGRADGGSCGWGACQN